MKEINLIPLDETQFLDYMMLTKAEFISEICHAKKLDPVDASNIMEQQLLDLLPNGFKTPGHYQYRIVKKGSDTDVGFLWYAADTREVGSSAFIYDIRITEEHRGAGYASAAMRALELEVRSKGISKLSLHVFGHNTTARNWYLKLGFIETDVMMSRQLSQD